MVNYVHFWILKNRSMRDSPLLDWFGRRYVGWERWLPYKNVTFTRVKWEDMYFEYLGPIGCTLCK